MLGLTKAKQDWVAPALLARDSGGCLFEKVDENGNVGYLTVPWAIGGISSLLTIDGQHRVLGIDIEKRRITAAISAVDRERARKVSPDRAAKLQAERQKLVDQMNRLKNEYVGLDIYVEPDPIKAQQMFVDVADNAKGISSAVRARFDNYKVANRTLSDVIDHPLLKGRVDPEQDRMTAKNPNFMGAKHVADITRAVIAGAGGRISKRAEQSLTDGEVIEQVKDFLDVISNAFAGLAAVAEDDPEVERRADELTTAQQLRRSSLLGSVGMLRVLGGSSTSCGPATTRQNLATSPSSSSAWTPTCPRRSLTPASGSVLTRATTSSRMRPRPSCERRTSFTW